MNTNIVFKTRFAFSPYFRYGFSSFSTAICIFSRFFDYFWFFFVSATKIRQLLITSEACCHFAPPKNLVLASSPLRQKTNLFKLGLLSLCAVKKEGLRMGH
jgi:hypothetical protein